jgi:hypothetical protein
VLSLDADERVSEGMKDSILKVKNSWQADGYRFNRLNNYCGSWLKHSWYPDSKIRLWDRRKGKWSGENPHDKVVIDNGKVEKLEGDIIHFAYSSVEEHLAQIIKFAVISANQKFSKKVKVNFFIHIILGPIFKFMKRYIFKLGFLDGYYGFIFSVLSALLNFLKYVKLWDLYRHGK